MIDDLILADAVEEVIDASGPTIEELLQTAIEKLDLIASKFTLVSDILTYMEDNKIFIIAIVALLGGLYLCRKL